MTDAFEIIAPVIEANAREVADFRTSERPFHGGRALARAWGVYISQSMKTDLRTRQLGRTDMHLSRVGFGAWAIGGGDWSFGWGPQDDADSLAAMRHAVERGINWIDTAAVYGLGHSEELVGRLLRELPADRRPYVFTKCGLAWDVANRMKPATRTLRPESIRREVDASLKRLGVERIDLYQFHWPDELGTPVEESWEEMERLVQSGKVRAAGVSNFDINLLERCEKSLHVDSLQPPFSLIRRMYAQRELDWCEQHGTGIIAYSPMQSGLLTDRFSLERMKSMAPDDWRRRSADYQSPQLERNIALRDALKPIAERHDTTVATIAIAWTLAWPQVTAAIVGARSPAQVDGWIDAHDVVLTQTDLDEIARAIERTGAGDGPARPRKS